MIACGLFACVLCAMCCVMVHGVCLYAPVFACCCVCVVFNACVCVFFVINGVMLCDVPCC